MKLLDLLQPLPTPSQPYYVSGLHSKFALFPQLHGDVVAIYLLTKVAHFVLSYAVPTALKTAYFFLEHDFQCHGLPTELCEIEVHNLLPASGMSF